MPHGELPNMLSMITDMHDKGFDGEHLMASIMRNNTRNRRSPARAPPKTRFAPLAGPKRDPKDNKCANCNKTHAPALP